MIEPDVVSDSHNPGEINKPKKKTRLGPQSTEARQTPKGNGLR